MEMSKRDVELLNRGIWLQQILAHNVMTYSILHGRPSCRLYTLQDILRG